MPDACATLWRRLQGLLQSFRSDKSGQILIIFALSSVAIFAGLGAGIDLATAFTARQRLSEVATLTCEFSTRPSVSQTAASNYSGTNGFNNYVTAVNAFAASSLTTQHWTNATPTGSGGTAGSYFTATPAVGSVTGNAVAAAPTNPVVEMSANIPTAFAKILNVTSITVHAKIACETLAYAPQIVVPPLLLKEGFEIPCVSGFCEYSSNPTAFATGLPTSTFPANAAFTGYNGFQWYVVGYCLETDRVGIINPVVPEGVTAAELDCGNGPNGNSAGNSSISTKLYLETGQYELRYNYRSRIDYPDYDPAYICGSTASDLAWANDTSGISPATGSGVQRTNQINVYLDANLPGTNGTVGSAPLHRTIDGTEYLAGSNLIDMCVYAPSWIERSVRIKVTTPGFYWLSFAADGQNDSYGGQLDNIRFCQETCVGPLQDNFPSAWTGKTLFEDTFEMPVYAPDYSNWIAKSGNLNLSKGTSGTTASGWPSLPASGWATAPYNQVNYLLQGAQQGAQYIALDGYNGYSSGSASRNRLISRPFLLDPGYYQVSYNYISDVDFSPAGIFGTNCSAAPASGYIYAASYPNINGYIRFYQSTIADGTTNLVGVFMANGQLVSTPNTGGALGSLTTYNNPDTTVSTTPTAPPDAVNWSNYNAAVSNPVIDQCEYADSFRWIPRSVSIKITKSGLYWLTFSANGGAADGNGGGIDDVKLTALGSPYMASPPIAPLVAIPVPAPQPDTSYVPSSYAGFTIVADPFTPPGADQ